MNSPKCLAQLKKLSLSKHKLLEDHFIKDQIEALDKEIEEARKMLATIEKTSPKATAEKTYKILKSKMMHWTNKRDFLLEHFVLKPLKKK